MLVYGNHFVGNNYFLSGYRIDPYNPLNLPANTIRVRTNDGNVPSNIGRYDRATLVDGTTNVYDVYKSGNNFDSVLGTAYNIIEILGANTTNVISMQYMCWGCTALTSVALFDTSKVTNMYYCFNACSALTGIPLFNTSSCTAMNYTFTNCKSISSIPLFDTRNLKEMGGAFYGCESVTSIPLFNTTNVSSMYMTFRNCYNVQAGALALYQQASTQEITPQHYYTFNNCGVSSQQGSAELAQIPSDWK